MASTPAAFTPGSSRSLAPEQIAHLQEAALAITASLETDEVLRHVVAAARALLRADAAVLFGVTPGLSGFSRLAWDGLSPGHEAGAQIGPAEAAVGKAVKERRIVGVADLIAAVPERRLLAGFAGREGFCSVLAAPLLAHHDPLGVLALYTHERRNWHQGDATLLSLFASHASVAVQNARLYERLNHRAGELEALCELSHLLGSFVEQEPLLRAVISRLVSWVGAKYGAVMLVERGENGEAELKIRAHHGFTPEYVERANRPGEISLNPRAPGGNGPASVSVRESRPCVIGDVFVDERFAFYSARAASAGYLAIAAVPLGLQGHVVGCIVLYYARRRDFAQSELNFLSAVADGVELAMERLTLSQQIVQDAVANRSVAESDRLKTEFVSTVSHELRTPLTIIKGYTDLMATEQAGELTETQRKFLAGVQKNVTRLSDLVSDLLDISRLESGRLQMARECVDIAQLVQDACGEFDRVAGERGVAVRCTLDKPSLLVQGDAGRIAQVVNNLLANAVKYSPPESEVFVTCDRCESEVKVSVRDEGPGIAQEAQGRLFQKFYRVDNSSTRQVGGTGLGLAIAKAIVEQHRGRIWVESAPGAGSTFSFALPAESF